MSSRKRSTNRDWLDSARFLCCIPPEDWDKPVCNGLYCYIDISDDCGISCDSLCGNSRQFIRCYNNTGNKEITNRMLMQTLINNNYEQNCRHFWLEGFKISSKDFGTSEIKISWGS